MHTHTHAPVHTHTHIVIEAQGNNLGIRNRKIEDKGIREGKRGESEQCPRYTWIRIL